MDYYESDIEKAKQIVLGKKQCVDDIAGLYRNTNEELTTILKDVDFNNKKVLSVLASSDQLLSALILGAKEVDTFDSNRLTEYYYYLRKWCLEDTKKYYLPADNKILIKTINNHYHENPLVAKLWLELIKEAKPNLYYSHLFYKTPINWNVPYEEKEEELIEIMQEKKHNFKCFNIFEKQNIDKKYDIILLSNIIEYLIDNEDEEKEHNFINNLLNILEDDGVIISTNITSSNEEELIIDKYFDRENGPIGNLLYGGKQVNLSYQFTKKKLTTNGK